MAAHRVCRIFHYQQPSLACQSPDPLHFAGKTAQMNWQDGASAFRDSKSNRIRIDIPILAHIRQNRRRPDLNDGIDGRAECQRRGYHLVSRTDPQRC